MNEEIIGIEVGGEIHAIKDEETSGKTETLEQKVSVAEQNIENLEQTATEQGEKLTQIETNIGETDIQELKSLVDSHEEEMKEVSEELPKIKADVNDTKFNGMKTPLFELKNIEAKGIGSRPTISVPLTIEGSGKLLPSSDDLTYFKCSLQFFNDCIAVTEISAARRGAITAEWTNFGAVTFGILYSYIKALLKSAYPNRTEEIDDYMDNVVPTFTLGGYSLDSQSLVFQGEPGAECITTQQMYAGGADVNYFSFRYSCDYIIKVISQGSYYGSTFEYPTFATVRKKA